MNRTNTYNLEYIGAGDFYSAGTDRRRFLTLDYNLNTYIGIVGDGIVQGWTINQLGGLNIEVTPGSGIIGGLFTETSYYIDPANKVPKRRSEALTDGDTIIAQIPGWSNPNPTEWTGVFYRTGGGEYQDGLVFDQLGPEGEDNDLDGVADGVLLPTYKQPPANFFSDPYVKASALIDRTLTLTDNRDNYVFFRKTSTLPSETFGSPIVALSDISSSDTLFLGKVVVRNGAILDVLTDSVVNLGGATGKLNELAKQISLKHTHGGSKAQDPAKIVLQTDIRTAYIKGTYQDSGIVEYVVLPSYETDTQEDHRHTAHIDSQLNGYTVETIGAIPHHYHKISGGVVSAPVFSYYTEAGTEAKEHTHSSVAAADSWDADSTIRVLVNDIEVDSSKYTIVDGSNNEKLIRFNAGVISSTLPIFSTSFAIDSTRTFDFTLQTNSFSTFYFAMQKEFTRLYDMEAHPENAGSLVWSETELEPPEGSEDLNNTIRSPFDNYYDKNGKSLERVAGVWYYSDFVPITVQPTTTSASTGFSANAGWAPDIYQQSQAASVALKKAGDTFTILPNLGKFIDVTLVKPGTADKVAVEVLDNVEVQGVLPSSNILFIDADKLTTGVFESTRIPFIDHIGRIQETADPIKFSLYSKNGRTFYPYSKYADETDGHGHRISINELGTGSTIATTVGNQISVYATKDDKPIRISHPHYISNWVAEKTTSSGVNEWQNQESKHEHEHVVQKVQMGNCCSVFSYAADASGNAYISTSNGLLLLPATKVSATVVFDGSTEIQVIDDTIDACLSSAANQYAFIAGEYLDTSLIDASVVGDNGLVNGTAIVSYIDPLFQDISADRIGKQVVVTIEEREWVPDPSLVKYYFDINEPTATYSKVVSVLTKIKADVASRVIPDLSQKTVTTGEDGTLMSAIIPNVYLIKQDLSLLTPAFVLNTSAEQMVVVFDEMVVYKQDVASPCSIIEIRNEQGGIKSAKAATNGDIWCCGDEGLFQISATTLQPLKTCLHYSSNDIALVGSSTIIVATEEGAYKSTNNGASWTQKSAAIFKQLTQDGSGASSTIFGITAAGDIYKTIDAGDTWGKTGATKTPESPAFACFGKIISPVATTIYISDDDGVSWNKLSGTSNRILGVGWKDATEALLLSDNIVYTTADAEEFEEDIVFIGSSRPSICDADNTDIYYGWTYNNNFASFTFNYEVEDGTSAVVSPNQFFVRNGGWSPLSKYDVYFNGKLAYSTRSNVDKRVAVCGKTFSVNPSNGEIRFENTSSLTSTAVRDYSVVFVSDTSVFTAGDTAIIEWNEGTTTKPIYKKKTFVIDSVGPSYVSSSEKIYGSFPSLLPIKVLSGSTKSPTVKVTVYESAIINSGMLFHSEIENALSTTSFGTPWNMSEVFLSNMSKSILALKYAIPDIDTLIPYWRSYMMRFSSNPAATNYIGDFFDVVESNLLSNRTFATPNLPLTSKGVSCVAWGIGAFSNLVFAGTDTGLYVATKDNNLESNWFYVGACPAGSVRSVKILPKHIVVAGSNGLFVSGDETISAWTRVSISDENTEATFVGARWVNFWDAGSEWWNHWDEENVNEEDGDLTNTILVGSRNGVIYSNDNGVSWAGATLNIPSDTSEFYPHGIKPLSDGSAILTVNNMKSEVREGSALLLTTGSGSSWSQRIYNGKGISVTITGKSITKDNNTIFEFSASQATAVPDGLLFGATIELKKKAFSVAYNTNSSVTVYGSEAHDQAAVGDSIKISPLSFGDIVEKETGGILVSSSAGLLSDRLSLSGRSITPIGTVHSTGKHVTVSSVDIAGTVLAILETNEALNKTTFLCSSETSIANGALLGKTLYFDRTSTQGLSILIPTPEQVFYSNSIVVQVSWIPSGTSTAYVAYQIDGGQASYTQSSTFELANLGEGRHSITVWTTDGDKIQNSIVSTTSFNVAQPLNAPSVTIQSPTNNQVFNSSTVSVTGIINNYAANTVGGISYQVDSSAPVSVPVQSSSFQFTLTNLSNSTHTLVVYLLDQFLEQTTILDSKTITVSSGVLPSIVISYPNNGDTIGGSSLSIAYAISNFSIPSDGKVRITLDETDIMFSEDPGAINVSGLTTGPHTCVAKLVNPDLTELTGSNTLSQVSFNVDTSISDDPVLTITSPANNQTYTSGTSSVNVSFLSAGLDIPTDGGVNISVNNGPSAFWRSAAAYPVQIASDGAYSVVATLATSVSTPLANPEASATVAFTIGSSRGLSNDTISRSSVAVPRQATALARTPIDQTTRASTPNALMATILQNSTTNDLGEFSLVVSGLFESQIIGDEFVIVGSHSEISVSAVPAIPANEFEGGYLYVSPKSKTTPKKYSILSNTASKVVLSGLITPFSAEKTIAEGDDVVLIPRDSSTTIWCSSPKTIKTNALAGQVVTVRGFDILGVANENYFVVSENNSNNVKILDVSEPWNLVNESQLFMESIYLEPQMSFCKTKTSEDLGHYHYTSLIQDVFVGVSNSISQINATTVRIPIDSGNYPGAVLPSNYDLLVNETIFLYSPSDPSIWYRKTIAGAGATYIDVYMDLSTDFDLLGNDQTKIGTGYNFYIDATERGITTSTTYLNFQILASAITEDIDIGDTQIKISDTSELQAGDSILVFDNQGRSFTSSVGTIVSGTLFSISTPITSTFEINNRAEIKAFRNSFPVSHSHTINRGEVSEVAVSEYFEKGYPLTHSHQTRNLISGVPLLLSSYGTGEIVVAGEGTVVYKSADYGTTWTQLYDMVSNLEGADTPEKATFIGEGPAERLVIGTDKGFAIYQGEEQDDIVSLEDPFGDKYLPSSSSSSSESSTSSSQTSSSLSSLNSSSSSSGSSTSSGLVSIELLNGDSKSLDIDGNTSLYVQFDGGVGDTAVAIINSVSFVLGNVGGQFVFDIGGAQEFTYTVLGQSHSFVAGALTFYISYGGII